MIGGSPMMPAPYGPGAVRALADDWAGTLHRRVGEPLVGHGLAGRGLDDAVLDRQLGLVDLEPTGRQLEHLLAAVDRRALDRVAHRVGDLAAAGGRRVRR